MSQTLTYVIGGDRRVNVGNIQDFKVDFGDDNRNWVQARQFERGMRQVFVNVVNEDNTPFDLTGCNVWFEGLLPKTANGDFRVIDSDGYVPLDPSSGKFRFDMPGQAFTVAGSYRQAFFRIVKNGNSVTTLEFDLDVLADKVIDGLVPKNWIGPFEQIADQLVDGLQKHTDAADKTIADFQQKVTDLVNQLNQQGSTTTSMLTEFQSRITDLEAKIKQDGLFTQAEAATFENKIQDAVTKFLSSYGLNVKDLGATGDGNTDDTKAFQDALSQAGSGAIKRVIIPEGSYVITSELTIPNKVDLVGIDNRSNTTLLTKGIAYLLEVGSNSLISNFSIDAINNGKDIILIKLGGVGRGVGGSTIKNLHLHGSNGIKTYGIVTAASGDNANIYNLSISNVVAEIVYDGIKFVSNQKVWINGNSVRDVTVTGFAHSALYLTSSQTGSLEIAQNLFTNIQFEAIPEAEGKTYDPNDIIGIRVEFGDRNKFTMLHGWDDDGKGACGLSVMPNANTTNLNSFRDNVFDGYVEGYIATNWYTAHYNDLSGLNVCQTNGSKLKGYNQLNYGNISSVRNLISDDLISYKVFGYDVPIFTSKNVSFYSSYDNYGAFLQANSNSGEMYITLSGNDHGLIPSMGKITVGCDVSFDSPENYNNVDLNAGFANFKINAGSTIARVNSTAYQREFAVDRSYWNVRVIANITVGDVSAYDVHALTLAWDGLTEGHIKVRRFFVVPNEINATQQVDKGRAAHPWTVQKAPGKITEFADMFLRVMPEELVDNPLNFDPNLLDKKVASSGTQFLSYPIWY
ncbi:hypothetical protein HMPREF0513_01360 [Limosilactobacillus fermentum 28-3-CHN]|uniref:BppU N-terminal domain-containing protein n=1 Tax=Limosilactobacillus fermentum 28-3-CHN TaxID=575599 RepID=D0DUM1_LIMFE|nr:BppU family phage baseplate upper protein [Limosilactobacillus fermentum]EEX25256.1 hypothetical protein HMPREF0513_01360 [Limosilactobacillus fermentum 28-3-CHN]